MAKRKTASSARRIPRAHAIPRSRLTRVDVTRGEFNRIIDVLNERNVILNRLREAVDELLRITDVQFKRMAQMQAELDDLRRAGAESVRRV